MNKAIIIIPIYKNFPDEFEIISLLQCLRVLHRYKICIVTYDSLDVSYYKNELQKSGVDFNFEYFEKDYFNDIAGYNRLLLSLSFYKRFAKYEYMLIYQLDAYVFRDDLLYWCTKGYDYIGAPWFENYGSHESGDKLWECGNGGFSLRRTSKILKILTSKFPIYTPMQLYEKNGIKSIKELFVFMLKCIGYKNNINYLLRDSIGLNEDGVFSFCFNKTWIKLKKPTVEVAMQFSFDRSPSYLFELNNKTLPFGCHSWQKYQYEEFWSNFIKLNSFTK